MDEDTLNELKKLMTSANDDFLAIIALLEAVAEMDTADYNNCCVIALIQDITRKNFKMMHKCKKLLNIWM